MGLDIYTDEQFLHVLATMLTQILGHGAINH